MHRQERMLSVFVSVARTVTPLRKRQGALEAARSREAPSPLNFAGLVGSLSNPELSVELDLPGFDLVADCHQARE